MIVIPIVFMVYGEKSEDFSTPSITRSLVRDQQYTLEELKELKRIIDEKIELETIKMN